MPGCEDPVNQTDMKTQGRGNRGKQGKGSSYYIAVLLTNRAHNWLLHVLQTTFIPTSTLWDMPFTWYGTFSPALSLGQFCLVDPTFL